jgi:DNA-binding LacI/PurR family transcriptional regulator
MTIEELAKSVNLNKSSVSRILNGKGNGHSDQTRTRVLTAAAHLGYQPNPAARALATGATRIVELWVVTHEDYSPYFGYQHHCLRRIGAAHGYRLVAEDVSAGTANGIEIAQRRRWPSDGVLTCDLDPTSVLFRHLAASRKAPIVTLGQGRDAGSDCVELDVAAGAREAVQHLLSAGCRRIAIVRSCPDARDAAYSETMTLTGHRAETIAAANHSRAAGYEALRDYVAREGCPDGLFCVNDELAIGCFLALSEMGLRVPGDVRLVGFDGLDNARLFPCPISSVVVPVEEMCRLAWNLLLHRLSAPNDPVQQRLIVPRLEARASSCE